MRPIGKNDSEVLEQGSRNNADGVPALFSESELSLAESLECVNYKKDE